MEVVKLKDVCEFEKGSTGLAKAAPGEYLLVTTGWKRKSCNSYQFDARAVCIPLVSSTGHGHASMKNVHYQEGKFALGTILVALTTKDENKLDIQFLHLYLSQLKNQILVPLMSGAANVALSVAKIKNIEIPLPPLKRQKEIVRQFKMIVQEEVEIISELNYQQALLKKLRQRILQESIEGKLTTDWRAENPDIEPANELLKRIAAEKTHLISEKIIKPQKLPPLISEEEKPFNLPAGWAWCRFKDIANLKSGNQYKYASSSNGVLYVKVGDMNIEGNEIEITTSSIIFDEKQVKQADLVSANSVIFPKRGGAIATNKRRLVLNERVLIDSNTMAVTPSGIIDFSYFKLWFDNVDLSSLGNDSVVPQVNNKDIYPLLVPLPPLPEQKAIVAKVAKLLSLYDQLADQISQNKAHAEQLMQAVLKEAFRHNASSQAAKNNSRAQALD